MKHASNYIIILLLVTTISCKRNHTTDNDIMNSNVSYINPDADSTFYKFWVYTENDKYFKDSKGNLIFLITNTITAFGKSYSNTPNGWKKAIKYYHMNESKFETKDLYIVTTIAIKDKKGNFDNIWVFNNHIDEHQEKDGRYTYGYLQFNVLLDMSNFGDLSISFKTMDLDGGYLQYTITYKNEGELWKLISRERIRTIVFSPFDEIGYCKDTIFRFVPDELYESDKFSFGLEFISDCWQ